MKRKPFLNLNGLKILTGLMSLHSFKHYDKKQRLSSTTTICYVLLAATVLCSGVRSQGCFQPTVPLNAKVTITEYEGSFHAKYQCDPGYELFGSDTIKCDLRKGWENQLPFCGTNVAFRKPVNQSSYTRQGLATFANDGNPGNQDPDGQQCSETLKEVSPWWKVDLLRPQKVQAVRITTRGCCGHQPLQDLEIRVGNSSSELQKNPLCAWYPGTLDEGITRTFICARALVGQHVGIQLVGVEGSLSLCEVEVFSHEEIATDQCAAPNLSVDTVLMTFSQQCYEFYITRGENFERARQTCKKHGGDLIHQLHGPKRDYVLAELDRRKTELKTQLVWIGAQKEPGLTSRTWRWVDDEVVTKPSWGKDQPNNYNGEQNCLALDGGRNWLWNDVGCNLDYLPFICEHKPVFCGSPDSFQNSTVHGKNFTVGNDITYSCPKGHKLIGSEKRRCGPDGMWIGGPPKCQFIDCGKVPNLVHGSVLMSENRTTFGVQATYVCHENYTLVGNENRTCELNGWTGNQPECLVDWCPDPPKITGGKVNFTHKRVGSIATYECQLGYVMIGEPVLSCGLGGEWAEKPPTCRFVDCGAPVRPDRGRVILLNDSTALGAIAKYECDVDHWLLGANELSCTREGRWSGDAPLCELITCDTPNVPPGSYVVGYDYNVHSSIQYHCDPGHILRGQNTLQCLDTGEWSGPFPHCEFIDCGPITPILHGQISYAENTTYIGSEVRFSCANSHRLKGSASRICLESGLWGDSSPKCEEIRCPQPIIASHSILSVTGNDRVYGRTLIRTTDSASNSIQSYKVGAIAKYRCERGYKIVGNPLVTCEETGSWSGTVPECIYVDCGTINNVENGKVSLTSNATYYGAVSLYECESGFKLNGVTRRLCQEDGTWSLIAPTCQKIICQHPSLEEYLVIDHPNNSVGSVATFSCQRGRTLMGNGTRTCLADGNWTGKIPVCKAVDCGRPTSIENGRVIVVNGSTTYGASAEYHCIPNFTRIGQYLRKCLEDGRWSGEEPKCEFVQHEASDSSSLGTTIGICAAIIIILLISIAFIFLHRNRARPVKNTENVQAAESKEDRSAAVTSYSTLEANQRMHQMDLVNLPGSTTTFQPNRNKPKTSSVENAYDQIPNNQYYDVPYEIRTNEEVYEPEPNTGNVITINGISVR